MKIEKKVLKLKENMQNNEKKRFFQFRETTRNTFSLSYFRIFFQFRETIETPRNSNLFRTASDFKKLKNTKLSNLITSL